MSPTPEQLITFIDRWQTKRIAVVGDFMLDRYVRGDASRLSPDAPVPVLHVTSDSDVENRPGGAANVCQFLKALKCDVLCFGLTGAENESMSRMLRHELTRTGCELAGLIPATDGRRTTVKFNLVGLAQHRHPQKMFRVDVEDRMPISDADTASLLDAVKAALPSLDALCLEDYNKGVLTEFVCQQLIAEARRHQVPVFVDPAAISDYSKYRGATVITPNRNEAAMAVGKKVDDINSDNVSDIAADLLSQLDLDCVVLTLDKQGALLLEGDKPPVIVPTRAREVYDVTGAGDMVLAALAAAFTNGADWPTAVAIANAAAGLEVEHFGVVPIELGALLLSLLPGQHKGENKVRPIEQLIPELQAYREFAGKKIAFTNGCFDILHAGHVVLLREARKTADMLVLAVNTDESISALKGPERPIVPLKDRLTVLSELECIDYIITFGTGEGGEADTPIPLLRKIKPDVLVKGGTYTHDEVVGHEIVEAYGGQIALINPVEGRSTTNIVERIKAQVK